MQVFSTMAATLCWALACHAKHESFYSFHLQLWSAFFCANPCEQMFEEVAESSFLNSFFVFLFALPFNFHFYWSRFWFHCAVLRLLLLSAMNCQEFHCRWANKGNAVNEAPYNQGRRGQDLRNTESSVARSRRICCLAAALMFIDLK